MTKLNEIYRCNVCGVIVEVVHAGRDMECCGEQLELLKENSVDASLEKHVPVIEKTKEGILVKVGSTPHPMEQEHYIEWIEVMFDGRVGKQFLNPGDKPEALFKGIEAEKVDARAYCNLHGLWKSEQ